MEIATIDGKARLLLPTEEMVARMRSKIALLQYAFTQNREIPAYMNDVFYFELEELSYYLPDENGYEELIKKQLNTVENGK